MSNKLRVLMAGLGATVTALAGVVTLYDGARIHPPEPALPEGFLYWGTSDTTIDPASPTDDFGGADRLRLGPGSARVLVRFDQLLPVLGGPYVSVRTARLTLHLAAEAALPSAEDLAQVRVYRLLRSWNEGGSEGKPNYLAATYLARYHGLPGGATVWGGAGASAPEDAMPCHTARLTFDRGRRAVNVEGLAEDVTMFLGRHYRNHGWLLVQSAGATGFVFQSREAVDPGVRPRLTIEYVPVQPRYPVHDLGIAFISRYPEYLAWKDVNSYEQKKFRGVPVGILKRPEFADVQKQPRPGEMLEYVGVVKNHGSVPLAGFVWQWRVNDVLKCTGVYTLVVPPQHQAYVWYSHPSPTDFTEHRDEWLTLAVEPLQPVAENKHNNELTIYTKARCIGVHCDDTSRAFYQSNYNAFGTYSFEDWIQFQLLYWNQIYFAKSRVRDLFPDGARVRARLQRVEFYRDGELSGPVHVAYDWRNPIYDGLWGWDFGTHATRLMMTEPDWFFRRTLRMCEPSLIHELSHQCFGLVDLYWMTMEPARDARTGAGGKIVLRDPQDPTRFLTGVGYVPKFGGLMGGGDTRYTPAHEGTTLYADHDVYGLNQNAPYRGGFFGDYLYDVQTSITVRVITADGAPAVGARVTAWQSTYDAGIAPIDDSKVVLSNLSTDARGEIVLPAQATLEEGPVMTLTGHTLRANPFGRIHVCGFNGNVLLHALYQGEHYFHMIMVWEQNVRFARGVRDHDTRVWVLDERSRRGSFEYYY
ncbi:MAG: hypothetical protein N2595_05235 [bacterium]|nr:hypothetical protein [bacterium]